VEKLQVTEFQIPENVKGHIVIEKPPLQLVASWMKNPIDNAGDEYEYELSFITPENAHIPLAKGTFYFTEKRPLHRFKANIVGPLPFKSPGLLIAECKIRKIGDVGWLIQNYPMIVEIGEAQVFSTNQKDLLPAHSPAAGTS
jgi:hypothetical protein